MPPGEDPAWKKVNKSVEFDRLIPLVFTFRPDRKAQYQFRSPGEFCDTLRDPSCIVQGGTALVNLQCNEKVEPEICGPLWKLRTPRFGYSSI